MRKKPKIASLKNMRKLYSQNNILAFSLGTLEEYSANPADYFMAREDWIMKDSEGEPMILVSRQTRMVPA